MTSAAEGGESATNEFYQQEQILCNEQYDH
jgi:hypothetical protein